MDNTEYAAPIYQTAKGETREQLLEKAPLSEPVIQYAKTNDGVSIAYYSIGSGTPPLVYLVPFSHVVYEWRHSEIRSWSEGLAANRRLVRLDRRGTGLSERDRDFTLNSAVHDIEAVARKEGLKRFVLMGQAHTSAIAILYASQHPEMVSHLVLWSPVARGQESRYGIPGAPGSACGPNQGLAYLH